MTHRDSGPCSHSPPEHGFKVANPELQQAIAATGERQRVLVAAMAAIAADQRAAIVLYDVEGYDYSELAEMTGAPPGQFVLVPPRSTMR